MKYLFVYLAVISILSVIVTIKDKVCAIAHKRRVREKTLFIMAFLGGCLGMYLTMLLIRHKTKHKRFMITLPLITIAWGVAIWFLFEV